MDLDQITEGEELDDELEVPRILRDLAEGRLTDAEVDSVVAMLQADGLEEAPSWAVNGAVRIAGQALGGDTPRPAMWRRLVAALVFDNRLQLATGARKPGPDQHPRLMYEAGGVEIDLEVGDSSIAGRLRMLGQVTASEPDLARAWVVVDGPSGRLETEVDELGQFSVDGLAGGAHRMEIGLTYELIEIPEVRL